MLPIRRLLLRDLLVLMAGLSALLLGLAWWGQQQALERQVGGRAQSALSTLDQMLRRDLETSQALGRTLEGWWTEGTLDPTRPEEAARLATPLLATQHAITSLNLARTDGRSLLFLHLGGGWSLRELRDPGPSAQVRWHRLGPGGRFLETSAWTPMAYDPRTRPWYQVGALSAFPVWTDPYVFLTTQDPGITYTLSVRRGEGVLGVVALDFLLEDLNALVWAAQPTPRSRCLVVDSQGRSLILPRDPAFESASARRQAFLVPPDPERLGPQARLLADPPEGGTWTRISAPGGPHVGLVRTFEGLPGLRWRLLLTIPEEDMLGSRGFQVATLLSLVGLGLAAWRILHIAQRVARPISDLSVAAGNLGQGGTVPALSTRILELQHLEQALRQAGENLEDRARLQRQLEHSQRLETVGTLAGGIAHDVNNQLAAILGQLHLVREHLPEGHPALARILRAEEATKRCAQTTKALLSFSHQSQPELKRLDLNALVGETALILDRLLGGRIRLVLDLAPDLPSVRGDGVQLEQVLMNLAINARDAMPHGGTLELRTWRDREGRSNLEALDSGTGIPEAALPHIFEPFFTTKDLGKGTGLGLAMAFGIIKAHRGTIAAENRPEGGARFHLTLPPCAGPGDSGAHRHRERPADPQLAGIRVLLAEDEAILREMLADALTLARAQVTPAPDGQVAWGAWQAGTFDLVLSDQRMPDCTGLELLERIRATGSTVPFILVSGQGLEGMEAALARDPQVRLLPKPFELPRLLDLMAGLLSGRRQPDPAS